MIIFPEEPFVNTGRPFLSPQPQESPNLTEEFNFDVDKSHSPKEILKEKYKKQEDFENQSIIIKEEDIKKMLQMNIGSNVLKTPNFNQNDTQNEIFIINKNFREFLKKMLLYFMGFVLTTSLVLITILCFLTYQFSNIIVYGSGILWSCLNLLSFLILHDNLPKHRKLFEILENFGIILIMVNLKFYNIINSFFFKIFLKLNDLNGLFYKSFCLIPHLGILYIAWHFLVEKYSVFSLVVNNKKKLI